MQDGREGDRGAAASAVLERAKAAAAAGDHEGMLVALNETALVDGLIASWRRKYPGLPDHEIREIVARAVVKTFEYVRKGRMVSSLSAFIFKTARNETFDLFDSQYRGRLGLDVEHLGHDPDAEAAAIHDAGEARESARAQALATAHRLLPRLGHGAAVQVMAFIIEAVEQGVADLPDRAIADALGLEAGTVKVVRNRAFERLTRLAAEEGVVIDAANLAAAPAGPLSEEGDEDADD